MSKVSPSQRDASLPRLVHFDEFSLGADLRRNNLPLDITPKAFAVLRLLVARAGDLVTKDALYAEVWPRVIVTDAALTMCVAELRRVLGDDARSPKYIATVPKRGYRFVYQLSDTPTPPQSRTVHPPLSSIEPLVGREQELGALREAFAAACRGQRRLAFVIGEPGIGKTALLDYLSREFADEPAVRIIRGQCCEYFGTSEPYLPLLDGIGQACRGDGGEAVQACLARHAPLWFAQLPGLVGPAESAALEPRIARASPERMLRELADAIDVLATDTPLVLVLEDLHWSDHATLDWVSYVARRGTPARLLIIASLRDAPAHHNANPLREMVAALGVHPYCRTVPVSRLESESIQSYLRARLDEGFHDSESTRLHALSCALQARTDGNPLFLVNLFEDALGKAAHVPGAQRLDAIFTALAEPSLPVSLQQFIALQLDRLSRDQRTVLEVAAVVGENVLPPLIAAALAIDDAEAEERCDALAQDTRLLVRAGIAEWPDGVVCSRYTFKHSLYRELLYSRQPEGRVVRVHRAVGQRLERGYSGRTDEIANELAVHFGRGHLRETAARYSLQAGRSALNRAAYADAEAQLLHGLAQLSENPGAVPDYERDLQIALGQTLIALRGWASPAAEQAFAHAYRLTPDTAAAERFMPLWGMAMGAVVRADFARYQNMQRRLVALADETSQPLHRACAHWAFGQGQFHAGRFRDAVTGLAAAVAGFEAFDQATLIEDLGLDFCVFAMGYLAHAWWILGDIAQATASAEAAVARAQAADHPFSMTLAYAYSALLHLFLNSSEAAARTAATVIDLSSQRGFDYYRGWGEFVGGWTAEDPQAAYRGMQQGLATMQSGDARLRRSYYFALLAERRAADGFDKAAREDMTAARDELAATHERCWEAEIERIDGVLLERAGDDDAAEKAYRRAMDIARTQNAIAFELRGIAALSCLLDRRGRGAEAQALRRQLRER